MRIAVIGATGWLGGAIAREALARGHQVTAIGRTADKLAGLDGMATTVADATDAESVAATIAGHDVAVLSVTDRSGPERSVIPRAAQALLDALPRAGVGRMAMVGGGGSLLDEDGVPLLDAPGFPAQYRAEAAAQGEALAILRAAPAGVDWTYLSPPPHDLTPGERRGGYGVRGDDRPFVDADGHAALTSGDLAAAMVDELERPQFSRRRFTAGYTG